MKSDLMTLNEVCDYLRLSRFSLYRLIKKGKLTGYRIHRRWYFKPEDVEAYRNYRRRIKYYGRIFPATVLTEYYQDPHKYQVTKKKRGLIGHLSLRGEDLKGLSKKQSARQYGTTPGGVWYHPWWDATRGPPRGFKPIKYHRVYLEGKYPIMVSPLVG